MSNALLSIDMQNAWIEENPRFDIDAIFERINALSERFRQQGLPVIFIQHQTNEVLPGTRDWQMHEKLTHDARFFGGIGGSQQDFQPKSTRRRQFKSIKKAVAP